MAKKRRRRGLGMLVQKHGKVVDIPVRAGTIVRLREGRNGVLGKRKAVVVGSAPVSDFSRAYGRQVYVCEVSGRFPGGANVTSTGAGDLYPVGKAKRVPRICKEAMADYRDMYPSLVRSRGRKRSR